MRSAEKSTRGSVSRLSAAIEFRVWKLIGAEGYVAAVAFIKRRIKQQQQAVRERVSVAHKLSVNLLGRICSTCFSVSVSVFTI